LLLSFPYHRPPPALPSFPTRRSSDLNLTTRHIGHTAQGRRVAVQIGASLLVDFALQAGAVEVAGVTVQAAAPTVETRTSEIATKIGRAHVQNLPTPSRNFLDLAALARGVT